MNTENEKNIIFVTISMTGGGTERVISVLANEAVKKGHHVTIMMIGDDRIEYELDDRIRVLCVSKATGGSLAGRLKRISAMRKVICQTPCAKVISMGSSASIFTLISMVGLKNSVVVSERNDPSRLNHKPIGSFMKIFRELLYRGADKVVLQTEDSKQCFSYGLQKNCTVIMNPLPDEIYNVNTDRIREKSIIGSGRLTIYKGYDLLIDAFSDFHKVHKDYVLKIFGKGELKEKLQERINDLGLTDCAHLCGFSDNMYDELTKGGMYVSSSVSEGVSNAIMEAVALKIPVIATDCPVGGSKMCIKDKYSGLLIKVGDRKALMDAMLKIAEDAEFRTMITENAANESKKWSVEQIWKQWEDLFD